MKCAILIVDVELKIPTIMNFCVILVKRFIAHRIIILMKIMIHQLAINKKPTPNSREI